MSELRFFMLRPTTAFSARINEPAALSYPLDEVGWDGLISGAVAAIKVGQTVLFGSTAGADDYGRQRIRKVPTTDTLYIGRSSRGTNDGEVNIINDGYITVLNEFRIWSKIPHIVTDTGEGTIGDMYKDSDIEVGTNTTQEPPVANAGPPAIGTIDPTTTKFRCMLPHYSPNRSFAVADGATIVSYAWVIPATCSYVGTSSTDSQIVIDCDAGFHWIELTVTDSNGKTHTTRTFVIARHNVTVFPGWIEHFEVTKHRVTPQGQTLSVKVTTPITQSASPDGTLVALVEGEPSSLTERDNVLFWGWHDTNPESIEARRTGTISESVLDCIDVAGALDRIGGLTQVLYRDSKRITSANPNITWAYMVNPTWDKLMHYLLHWHSTALELADFEWTNTGDDFAFIVREAGGASLYDQVNRQAGNMLPNRVFTCDRLGRLAVRVDPMLQAVADRTSEVQENIYVSDWASIDYTYMRHPRAYWLDASAIQVGTTEVVPLFSQAPGSSPGQGESFHTQGEQIAPDQDTLNEISGHRYARLNARNSHFQIQLTEMSNNTIDPAAMEWVTVQITAALAAERGLVLDNARGLVHELVFNYKHTRTGVIRTADILWEREVSGFAGITIIPPEVPDIDVDPFPQDEEEEEDIWTNPPKAYVFWDGAHIFRTMNIMDASPTWEFVDTGITGRIFDCRYARDGDVVHLWCLTADGVWYCNDILATTPSWTNKLSTSTIQSTEVQPTDGNTIPCGMATWGYDPDYLIVATGFDQAAEGDSDNNNYQHCYFWHTHDLGDTWTTVDIGHLYTDSVFGDTQSYAVADLYGMEMYRDADGIVYCARGTGLVLGGHDVAVFKSEDQGHTWSRSATTWSYYNFSEHMSVLHPYPDRDSPCWFVGGSTSSIRLYVSEDEFETASIAIQSGSPTGYARVSPGHRPNSNPSDPNHAIMWAQKTGANYFLLETTDKGATWTELYDSGFGTQNVTYPNGGRPFGCYYGTPNGWPSNPDIWFIVRQYVAGGDVTNCILMTDDKFATTSSKEGNLHMLLGGDNFTRGTANGIALPKVGVNA